MSKCVLQANVRSGLFHLSWTFLPCLFACMFNHMRCSSDSASTDQIILLLLLLSLLMSAFFLYLGKCLLNITFLFCTISYSILHIVIIYNSKLDIIKIRNSHDLIKCNSTAAVGLAAAVRVCTPSCPSGA